jgi:hypothetical protein
MFNLRGPQGQNPRTTCGPRTTVWETLTYGILLCTLTQSFKADDTDSRPIYGSRCVLYTSVPLFTTASLTSGMKVLWQTSQDLQIWAIVQRNAKRTLAVIWRKILEKRFSLNHRLLSKRRVFNYIIIPKNSNKLLARSLPSRSSYIVKYSVIFIFKLIINFTTL